jgi:hypothetical protein
MADRCQTFAGLLIGGENGKTITVPDRDGDLVDSPARVIVDQRGGVVALFVGDETLPRMLAADATAVVS